MEPEYLRKFLALGLAGVRTPNRVFVGKLAPVVLVLFKESKATLLFQARMAPNHKCSAKEGGI